MHPYAALSEMGIERIAVNTRVRSLVTYAEGVVLSKDTELSNVEIRWQLGEDESIITQPLSRLKTVVIVNQS